MDCSLPVFSDHGTLQRDYQSNHSWNLTQFSSTIYPGKPLIFCWYPLDFTNMATLSLLNPFFSQLMFNWTITMCEGLPWWLKWARTCLWRKPGRPRFHVWIRKISWRREWQPTPAFLPGDFHGLRSLVHPWGCKESDTTESDTTERLALSLFHFYMWRAMLNWVCVQIKQMAPNILTLTT